MKQLNITELDFDNIKTAIKDYYRNGTSIFKDWDFEGSGLNIILDILAYNTHYNAMLAHLAANEGFLGSSQLRKNVVARAKTLGYLPHSVTASSANIHLTGADIETFTEVPKKTRFTSTVSGIEYSFVTAEPTIDIAGSFNGDTDSQGDDKTIKIFQGEFRSIRYTFSSSEKRQKFVIPDKDADISTKINATGDKLLTVKTYPHTNTSNVTSYTQFTELSEITATSNVFFISENSSGFYEIEFGDDVLGKKPDNGSVVEIEYFVTDGADANGAGTFELVSTLSPSEIEVNNGHKNSTISSGGGAKESIEQIRANAPISFTAQDRAVTVDDYKSIVLNNSSAQAVSIWGGEDNDPVDLGSVYISAKHGDDVILTSSEKDALGNILKDKGVLTLQHKFLDPAFVYLYFKLFVKYNPNLTDLTNNSLISSIRTTIKNFDDANLEDYSSVFRYSQFLQFVDNADPAILSTTANIFSYVTLALKTSASEASYSSSFTFALDLDGFDGNVIDSEEFAYSSGNYKLSSITGSGEERYIILVGTSGEGIFQSDGETVTFGTVNTTTGAISLSDTDIHNPLILDSAKTIKVFARPASNDVIAKRNTVIQIDENLTSITADIDNIALSGNAGIKNYVTHNRE